MNSFLQGKKTLSIAPLRPLASGMRTATTPPASAPRPPSSVSTNHGQPTVEVVKEGDKVIRLVVICSCGERTEIECLYPAGS